MNKFYKSLLLAALIAAGGNAMAQNDEPKIADFTSVMPTGQTEIIRIPSTHAFQLIAQTGVTTYTGTDESIGDNNDFTGYIPVDGSSTEGYLSVNHETTPGGVSILNLNFDEAENLWEVGDVRKVDFGPVQSTIRNCSGGVTAWGTVITSEENTSDGDADGDGYEDIGWQVEIDPVTAEILDHDGDGNPDKLWSHGRINHENIVTAADGSVSYQAEDGGSSCVFKFVPETAEDLSEGTLYVLAQDSEDETVGEWIEVPDDVNTLNNLRSLAPDLGGTNWRNPEDVEIGPDGKIYFTSKGTGTIWRFMDDGDGTVSEIEPWVTEQYYEVEFEGGTQMENWGTGIDNLAFDADGNLWAQQDGGRNNVWVIHPDHTPDNPSLKLFMTTPSGSESTGLTFSPDGRFGFLSIQHPSGGNTAVITDAAGNEVRFDEDVTLVFARKEALGGETLGLTAKSKAEAAELINVYPNPFEGAANLRLNMPESAEVTLEVYDMMGRKVSSLYDGPLSGGEHFFDFAPKDRAGNYMVRLIINNQESASIMLQQR